MRDQVAKSRDGIAFKIMYATDVSEKDHGEESPHQIHSALHPFMKASSQGKFAELKLRAYVPIARFKHGCLTSPARLDM